MESQPRRPSATIHPFPPGGRAGIERRKAAQSTVPAPRFGGGWYHEQAIKDASDETNAPPRH